MQIHTVSFDVAKELSEKGFTRNFYSETYPAPVATEILEYLPWRVRDYRLVIYKSRTTCKEDKIYYEAGYVNYRNEYLINIENENLCDALAQLWIYYKEQQKYNDKKESE